VRDDTPLRVLVIDDDPDALLLMEDVLGRRGGLTVRSALRPDEALAMLHEREPDVLVTDVELPGMTGLELLTHLRSDFPNLPVVVVTANPTVDYAVGALRGQAGEFLGKPLDPDGLLRTVTALGTDARAKVEAARRVVLAVGAHPDDVEIGVGGLLSAHHARGDRIGIVTLTRGARGGESMIRENESTAAANLVNARLFLSDLEDTRIPISDPTVSTIQACIAELSPDVVYTHSLNDLHQDHRAVHQATMVAARRVPTVACYQSPSATVDFHPNRFAAIDDHVDRKLDLLSCFASQATQREYLESDVIVATARYWSRYGGGGRYTEPLEVMRDGVRPGPQ
jgi:two-component system response regulator HydG